MSNTFGYYSRKGDAKQRVAQMNSEEQKKARLKCQQKIKLLVDKISEDYSGKGRITVNSSGKNQLGYVTFEAKQKYQEYRVDEKTETNYYRSGYTGTVDLDSKSIDLTPNTESYSSTSYYIVEKLSLNAPTVRESVRLKVTDGSEEERQLENQLNKEPLQWLHLTKGEKQFVPNPAKVKYKYSLQNLFYLMLNIF